MDLLSPSGSSGLASLVTSSPFYSAFTSLEPELSAVRLKSGETLFSEGEAGDALYVVVFGRLRALRSTEDGRQVLGEIGRGESVGEMALLTGEPRSATVHAIRNTELVKLSKRGFERMAEQQPQAMLEMARLITLRYRRAINSPGAVQPAVFAVVPCDQDVPAADFTESFVLALSSVGSVLALDPVRVQKARQSPPDRWLTDLENDDMFGWLDVQELQHDYLVYMAEPQPSPWTRLCLRQADLVFVVGRSGTSGQMDRGLRELLGSENGALHARREMVLLHDSARSAPHGTAEWLAAVPVTAHHHIDPARARDYERLVRMVTGRAVGLVLGGGGARGLAHIGVIRALEEAGIPIDLVGGTSIGANMAAQYASGWDSRRMAAETRRAFIDGGSLNDFTLPLLALLHGRRFMRAFKTLFSERLIEDLPINCFCVSTNLTRSVSVVHRSGSLWKAVAASMAVPGLAPPLFDKSDVLVDGGVLNNLPVDVMRGLGRGPVLASSVSGTRGPLLDREYAIAPSPWHILLSRIVGTPMRLPSIANILMTSATLSNAVERALGYPEADLIFEPPVEHHKLLDWHALDELIGIGYRYAAALIDAWPERRQVLDRNRETRAGRALRHHHM